LDYTEISEKISTMGIEEFLRNPKPEEDKNVVELLKSNIFSITIPAAFFALLFWIGTAQIAENRRALVRFIQQLAEFGITPLHVFLIVAVVEAIILLVRGNKHAIERTKQKRIKRLEEIFDKWEKEDGKQKNLNEIEMQITNGQMLVTEMFQIVTPNWFISPLTSQVVKFTDIAAITASSDTSLTGKKIEKNTYILATDGTIIATKFGDENWRAMYDLFSVENPYILLGNDAVAMPNGKDKAMVLVFSSRKYDLIIKEFLHRKRSAKV